MYYIALRMLLGDRAKYIMLVSALSFATLLMTQQSGVFNGLMLWTTATLRNTDVPIWVMDPMVQQVNEVKPMRDTDLARVRSVDGVEWAVPFYFSLQQARLYDGRFKSIQLIGLDSSTLIGAPSTVLSGDINDLWQADAVMVDKVGIEKLSRGRDTPLQVGDIFEINDHEARIVAIVDAARSFFGYPYVYTTYERAIQFAPPTRRNLSFVLVKPQEELTPKELAARITKETGLKAVDENTFFWETIWWFIYNTGIPVSFGTIILLGFLVGVAVCGQTFYTFILENLGNIGALKAMGASNGLIYRMLLCQAYFIGFIGYGIGSGMAAVFGYASLETGQPPFYMPPVVPVIVLLSILGICTMSAYIAIRRIRKLEPAEVFRA